MLQWCTLSETQIALSQYLVLLKEIEPQDSHKKDSVIICVKQ